MDQERSHMAHLDHSRRHQRFLAWRVALQPNNQTCRLVSKNTVLHSILFIKNLTLLELKQGFLGSLCSFLAARSVTGSIIDTSDLLVKQPIS